MNELTLIYHFQSSQNQNGEFLPARYRVVFFFHAEGFVERNLLVEMAKSVVEANHLELTFLNLDDLKSFALRVAQEVEGGDVRLISVQDYNIGIEGARDLKSFREIFPKFGEVLVSEGAGRKKSGLLAKLFS